MILRQRSKEHGLPGSGTFEDGLQQEGKCDRKVIKNIDPRFFKVATMTAPSEEEKRKPFCIVT